MIMDMTVIQQEQSITAIKGGGKNEKNILLVYSSNMYFFYNVG